MRSVKIAVFFLCSSGISVCGGLAFGPARLVEVVRHALLAARDLEQLAVEIDVPLRVDPGGLERAVERDAMAVPLGVDEHTVAVEDQRLHLRSRRTRGQATFDSSSLPRFAPPNCVIFSLNSCFSASYWAPSTFSGSYLLFFLW